MSDDAGSAKEIVDMATSHSGWVVAILAGTWGIVLRALIGRYLRWEEKRQEFDEKTLGRLAKIEERLAVIEARSHDRRREDKHQWEDDPT
jgi:hypothetical protein